MMGLWVMGLWVMGYRVEGQDGSVLLFEKYYLVTFWFLFVSLQNKPT